MTGIEVPFTLKTLSDKTGVPKETLRDWLQRKGIEPVGENAQGHPVFNSQTVERVCAIRKLRDQEYGWKQIKGKSIEEIMKLGELVGKVGTGGRR